MRKLSIKKQQIFNELFKKHFKGDMLEHDVLHEIIDGPMRILRETGDIFDVEELLIKNKGIYDRTGFVGHIPRYQVEKLKKNLFAIVDDHRDRIVEDIFLTEEEAEKDARRLNKH